MPEVPTNRTRTSWPGLLALAGGATLAAACTFSPAPLDPPGAGIDVDGGGGGGGGNDSGDGAACSFAFRPHFLEAETDPCEPPNGYGTALDIPAGERWHFDTSRGNWASDSDGKPGVATTVENGVLVLWVNDFDMEAGATLRATGNRPLMIVSKLDAVIRGTLDVGSAWDGITPDPGAGADEAVECSGSGSGGAAGDCEHGGGGGGGGGFGASGGPGGRGGGGRDCDEQSGSLGGGLGQASVQGLALRGGCPGGRGGHGSNPSDDLFGIGGAGGGAVHVVAAQTIQLEGVIYAGGGGGAAGQGSRAGGGGGGSGGFIGLEAPDIALLDDSVLAANGGGGGGGTNSGSGTEAGTNGLEGAAAAAGGLGDGGTDGLGGDGGAFSPDEGQAGESGDRGGGGGGGAAGKILFLGNVSSDRGVTSPSETRLPIETN
ncbi:hypothetical protein [Haliangium ochraceum]|uniref:PE-PGRS family protein n=1 Tax=Haliangium ochraceum (strain DSM 14365 / JCM 11303 / SMP-2) TaxID=502025 RepID=D0LLB4_HALO1|nr:hypothetical protein [Haliangium ochraceum]ACY18610.1 hypothetical protein Hoch_6135 [Haliangium ochraceum DSM 14365]